MATKRKTQPNLSETKNKIPNQSHSQSQSTDSMPGLQVKDGNAFLPYFTGSVVRCGAKTRNGTPCRVVSMANGRCRVHGGKNPGAPKGNKNSMIHGAHERILFSVLNDEEVDLWDNMKSGVLENLEVTLKVITIRELRMLERIETLRESGDFTTVEITRERGETEKGYKDLTTRKKLGTLGQIQAIEEALTKVQEKKARMLELKHKIETASGKNDVPNFDKLMTALAATAKEVWGDEE